VLFGDIANKNDIERKTNAKNVENHVENVENRTTFPRF